MKIILYGINETSYLIANTFNQNHDITVMDDIDELPSNFEKLDIKFVNQNATNPQSLENAGIHECDLFIACTKLDEVNIVAAWTAKKISDVQTVAFVSKLEYFKNLKGGNNSYFEEMGIDYVLWAQELLVQEIYRIITVPEAIDVEYIEGGKARLFEYRIKENTPILNKELKDCFFPEGTIIVGISRDNELFIPNGSTKLKLDDKAFFMGTENAMNSLAQHYFFSKDNQVKEVAIIGGGDTGYMLAQKLENAGLNVKLAEKNPERCELLADKLSKTLVLNANGTDIEFLESEEISECDVVINVTSNDETNLLNSLLVKQLGVRRVITRVNNENIVNLFEKVGVDVAISPNHAIVNELKNKIIEKSANILLTVEQNQAEIIEAKAPEKFFEKTIRDIRFPVKAVVGIIKRGKKIIIPKGDTLIRENDTMIIFTKSVDMEQIKDFVK